MNKTFPIYDVELTDEDQGVGFISLVQTPAIGVDWIKLSEARSLSFKANKDRQMLYGPFLIPNMLIYRFSEKLGPYYVRFSKEQIAIIAQKFNEGLNNKNINFQHTDEKVEAFVAENWIIQDGSDKSMNFGFELPEGSWFGGVKVKDEDFWINKVKTEEVKGFSVEILADLRLNMSKTKNKQDKMKKTIKLANATLADGTIIYYDGELAIGTALFTDEAMTVPVPNCIQARAFSLGIPVEGEMEWTMNDGSKVYTMDGIITKIEAPETPAAEDLAVEDTTTPVVESKPISMSEVSAMIDARFSDLMSEISKMKELIDQKDEQMAQYKKEVEEKFSTTPALGSVRSEKVEVKLDDRFNKDYQKIIAFAKS